MDDALAKLEYAFLDAPAGEDLVLAMDEAFDDDLDVDALHVYEMIFRKATPEAWTEYDAIMAETIRALYRNPMDLAFARLCESDRRQAIRKWLEAGDAR